MNRALIFAILLAGSCATAEPVPAPVHRPGLENAHWITGKVISGAQPEGDEAFRELAELGVKTVISVDGAKPDVEAARRFGIRTVHLPIGYDGVPKERTLELAKAIEELPGPVYMHCHHGQHRGPAAAVVACVVAGRMDNARAVETMKTLGTGAQYAGLWESARTARKADAAELRDLRVEFREIAPVPPLAEAMVGLDGAFEHLQLCAKAGWTRPAEHPDVDPAHEALKVREIGVEIMRTDDFKTRSGDFQGRMAAMRAASERLELLLRAAASREESDRALAALKQTCADCHKPYRNVRPR
ncbi:MAG TPA: hypothetical protein VE981_15625 [Planctomycetota bacterium]|nr:hypothetical protein [Planctomycetota bacterium]